MLTPRPYQEVGRDFLAARTRALLADEMRVGKTPQAILAAKKIDAQSLLVLCPAIAVSQWRREIARWWGPQGTARSVVLSYDTARRVQDTLKSGPWDVLIVDEAHFAKNPTAQRTQMVYGKGGLGYYAKHIWALSGTPAPKHAAELWPMLRAFGVVGLTYEEFARRYCHVLPDGRITGTKQKWIPELRMLLDRVMLRRKRKDVAPDMAEIDFQFLEVEPHVISADLNVPAGLTDDELLAWLEAHRTTDREDRVAVAEAKAMPLAEEIRAAIEGGLLQQTVVFGWHVEPLMAVRDLLVSAGISVLLVNGATPPHEKERVQQMFQTGRLQVLAANIMTAGTAIDLSAASHAYFLELDWVPGNNLQAANRLVSMDKHEPVTFDVVTWPGSTDDRVQSVLMRRVRELNQLL